MEPRATIEEWRPTHHPDYDVSNLGRVRSRIRGPERILRPGPTAQGYASVVLGGKGILFRRRTHLVHALVAAAFLGPCPEGQEVRHKDDNRMNPRADNLEYGTRSDNMQDAIKRDRISCGEKHSKKLTAVQVEEIHRLGATKKYFHREIAAMFGVSRQTVAYILSGRNWKYAAPLHD